MQKIDLIDLNIAATYIKERNLKKPRREYHLERLDLFRCLQVHIRNKTNFDDKTLNESVKDLISTLNF